MHLYKKITLLTYTNQILIESQENASNEIGGLNLKNRLKQSLPKKSQCYLKNYSRINNKPSN